MLTKSPSGALSPYHYKGGYFHGIHYGSYFDNMTALCSMMEKEEAFILCSPEKRRIMIDLYETNLTKSMLVEFSQHIKRLEPRIWKLAIAADKQSMKRIQKTFKHHGVLCDIPVYFSADMEEGKTWLVRD